MDIRQFKKKFSRILDNFGTTDIGLYEETNDGGLPGFAIIMTSATFHIEEDISNACRH